MVKHTKINDEIKQKIKKTISKKQNIIRIFGAMTTKYKNILNASNCRKQKRCFLEIAGLVHENTLSLTE